MIRRRTSPPPELPETADLILTSDWHIREDQPICRTDDFWTAQWAKVKFVADLQQRYNCPVIHAGDLSHHWKWSPWLLTTAMQKLPERFYSVYGQHDLPQHSIDLAEKCGMNTLIEAGMVTLIDGNHFGVEEARYALPWWGMNIMVLHRLVWTGERPWPGCEELNADQVLDKYPTFELIVCGDNHKPFTVERGGRLLVNPGSLSRQTADQADMQPRVYLWTAQMNTVVPAYLPIEPGVVSREHIERVAERDGRIEAFLERVGNEFDAGMSFEDNLAAFAKANKVRQPVMEIILRAIGR